MCRDSIPSKILPLPSPMPGYNVDDTLEVILLHDESPDSAVSGDVRAKFQITHSFLPFASAVVLKACVPYDLDNLKAGSTVVLKLYDRRFISREEQYKEGQAWTERSEHLARERWAAFSGSDENVRKHANAAHVWTVLEDEASIEQYWHEKAQLWYMTEVEAYKRLQAYQGTNIPAFYHSFRLAVDMTPGQTIPLDAAHMPHGTLIQHLEGAVTAADVPDPQTWPNLSKSTRDIMSTVSMLPAHGIIHDDIRSQNVLLGRDNGMLIDFGSAKFRSASISDADWQEEYEGHDDIGAARWILHRRGLRAESPIPPFPGDEDFLESLNISIHNHESSWIDRWYDTLLDAERIDEIMKDRARRGNIICYKKKEVEAWQANRGLDYAGFQQPRPGSPDWQGLPA